MAKKAISKADHSGYLFATDYCDHFETPLIAYEDIQGVLEEIRNSLDKSSTDLTIYDPYYCKGTMVDHLSQMGYTNVINRNKDFYEDIRCHRLPEYDILVTNPPFSGEHKMKLFDYLAKSNKPFAVLLPSYIATKSYFKSFIQFSSVKGTQSNSVTGKKRSASEMLGEERAMIYLLPPDRYEYQHPEGTGKDQPPFYSSWFIGGFPNMSKLRLTLIENMKSKKTSKSPHRLCTILSSVDELVSRGYCVDKRPNPKTRKRLKLKQQNHS